MKSGKKKRVYFEDIKARHTTHWDLDFLSQAELDALYAKNRRENGTVDRKPKWFLRRSFLKAVLAGATALLLAVVFLLIFR